MIQFKNECVTVFESSLFRTTSSIILTPDMLLLTDPNWLPGELQAIRQWVDFFNKRHKPLFLLFTHSDYDHIIGYRAFPEAKVIAAEDFEKNEEKAQATRQALDWDDEYYIRRNYPIEYPKVDIPIREDGQTLRLGNTLLTFYLAPGHSKDGIFVIVESHWQTGCLPVERSPAVWIAGDYLSNIEFPYIYYNSLAYEHTLAKADRILEKHDVRLLITGHGDVALHKIEIKKRQQESLDYIRSLRKSLEKGLPYPSEKLWERYSFRRSMEVFHEENIQLLRSELGEKASSTPEKT